MIPTGSKFFYALAGFLLVAAVVYGWSTGGDVMGPLSLGYKGGVGDHLGYGILLSAGVASLFAGFCTTAFRDADPDVGARLLGLEAAPAPTAASPSYWPVVGAFAVVLLVVGAVLNNVFFVAGLIALGAVAVEWTMQAWAERATGDPAVNREIRNRIMFPIEVPVAGALAIAVVVFGYSRVFLAVSELSAVWVAISIAALIFGTGTLLALRPRLSGNVVAAVLVVAAVATIGGGIAAAVAGERDIEHHEEGGEHQDEGSGDQGEGSEDHDDDAGSGEDADSAGVGEDAPDASEDGAGGAEGSN